MLHLITGGSGSGKSAYAEDTAVKLHKSMGTSLIYLAAMKPQGEEAARRIAHHRELRSGKGFTTVECAYSALLSSVKVDSGSVVLLECLTNLLANDMFDKNEGAEHLIERVLNFSEHCGALVAVSGEVFSDGEKYDEYTMNYIRQIALINRALAERADRVTEVCCGIPIEIKER